MDIPVKYIGVGETIDDLQKFDADAVCKCIVCYREVMKKELCKNSQKEEGKMLTLEKFEEASRSGQKGNES